MLIRIDTLHTTTADAAIPCINLNEKMILDLVLKIYLVNLNIKLIIVGKGNVFI